jgi:hypothetical protein
VNPFLLTAPFAGLLALALVAAAIIGLHRLKSRPVRRSVPSAWLWQAATKRLHRRPSAWRWWLALALCLALGTLLTIALTRPDMQGLGEGSRRIVVVVDDGPTMAARTRDGRTRWLHALEVARSLIAAAPGPVMLTDSMGRIASNGFVARADALALLDGLTLASAAGPLPPALAVAPGTQVHFIGDGVGRYELPDEAIVHSVFEPADNVAVIRLVARALPSDPTRMEAFVQVLNASPGHKDVRLTLRGGERYTVVQALHMAPGELADATFDVSAFEGGVLAAAAISHGDAFPSDDIAYAVVQPHRVKRVELVTHGNAALADALAALPGVRVQRVDPSRYRQDAEADAYVFDGFAPPQPPQAGALLFDPPPVSWLPAAAQARGHVAVDDWDRGSPLAAGVAWDAVSIRRASTWPGLSQDMRAVVRTGGAALVASGRSGVPWTAVGFRTGDSDLTLQPGFAAFLGNALAELMAPVAVRLEPLGPVRVAIADAQVRDGRGRPVESRSIAGATIFTAERPDIYTVSAASGRTLVAAAVLDPHLAQVNATRLPEAAPIAVLPQVLPLERWAFIALACLALLLIDWAAYMRRITR